MFQCFRVSSRELEMRGFMFLFEPVMFIFVCWVSPFRSGSNEAKGFVVHFGHESWNMVINIMVGIRLAGSRAMSEPHRAVEPYDFLMKEKFSVLPRTGMVDKKHKKPTLVGFVLAD